MKKTVISALAVTAALAATPAFAGTHISIGLFAPQPVYAAPVYAQPVVYYPPVQHAYYAPPRPYYVDNHRGRGHDRHYARWGQPRYYGWR